MMNKVQERNLRKLANGLLNLSAEYMNFDMGMYCETVDDFLEPREAVKKELNRCGTIACAAGHGPSFGVRAKAREDWGDYIERAFGAEDSGVEYTWCFSGVWKDADNTAQGAALRIFYMLDYGVPKSLGDIADIHTGLVSSYTDAYDIV